MNGSELPADKNETEERKKLHEKWYDELHKRQVQNADNLDKAILTYSSSGLAISLAFLKDIVPIGRAIFTWTLYASWVLFLLAIVSTLISYISSQRGLNKQLQIIDQYYIYSNHAAASQRNFFASLTNWLAYVSCGAFVLTIISSVAFVSINLERESTMIEQKQGVFLEGAPIPAVQQVPLSIDHRGAPVPGVQQLPQAPAQRPGEQNPGSGAGGSNGPAGTPGGQRPGNND